MAKYRNMRPPSGCASRQVAVSALAARVGGAAVVALAVSLASRQALAIGLGADVLNQSHIGEPLHALIPVVLAPEEPAADVRGWLEDPAAYADRGVAYPPDLAGVSLDVITIKHKPFLRLVGKRPMREPAIQLFVVVAVRGAELHREYDLLPDVSGSAAGPAVAEVVDGVDGVDGGAEADAAPRAAAAAKRTPTSPATAQSRASAAMAKTPLARFAFLPHSLHVAPPPAASAWRSARAWMRTSGLNAPMLRMALTIGEGGGILPAVAGAGAAPLVALRKLPIPAATRTTARGSTHWATVPHWTEMLLAMIAAVALLMLLARRRVGASGPPLEQASTVPASAPAVQPMALGRSKEPPPPLEQARHSVALAEERSFGTSDTGTVVGSLEDQPPDKAQDFYSDIAGLLRGVIEQDPRRRDLHMKLLEVYFSAGLAERFVAETRVYLGLMQGGVDEQWPTIVRMGRKIAPESGLYTDKPPAPPRPGSAAPIAPALPTVAVAPDTYKRHYDGVNQAALNPRFTELDAAADRYFKNAEFQQSLKRQLHAALTEPLPALRHAKHLAGSRKAAQLYGMLGSMPTHADERRANAIGQVSLAKAMGKTRVVASGDDLSHATALAAAAAHNALACTLYVEAEKLKAFDGERLQHLRDLGADVVGPQDARWQPFATARQSALTDWVDTPDTTLYVSGLDAGPAPYPRIVRHFQAWIGAEIRERFSTQVPVAPAVVVVGRTDDYFALGVLQAFLDSAEIRLVCVDAPAGQRKSVGHRFQREHSWLASTQRVQYVEVDDDAARLAVDGARLKEGWGIELGAGRTLAKAIELASSLAPHRSVLAVQVTSDDVAAAAASPGLIAAPSVATA